jgi:hypothetical protein
MYAVGSSKKSLTLVNKFCASWRVTHISNEVPRKSSISDTPYVLLGSEHPIISSELEFVFASFDDDFDFGADVL